MCVCERVCLISIFFCLLCNTITCSPPADRHAKRIKSNSNPFPSTPPRQGLRGNVTDACERHDPCQHGGICISTDAGPLCECRNVEYEGTYCERGKFSKLNTAADFAGSTIVTL